MKTPHGLGWISGFPTFEASLGFHRVRTFRLVRVRHEDGEVESYNAKNVAVVTDG